MLERVYADELAEMLVDMDYEPWGEERDDHRAARMTAEIVASAGVKVSDVDDYRMKFEPPILTEEEKTDSLWGKILRAFGMKQ